MDAVELGPFGLSQINYPAIVTGLKSKPVKEKGEIVDQVAELTFALTVTPADFYRSPYFSCAFQDRDNEGMYPAPGSHTDIDAEVDNWQPAVKRRHLNEDWRVLPAAAIHATRITPDEEKSNAQPTAQLTIVCEGLPHELAGEAWYMNEWELHFEPLSKPEQLSIEPADDLVGIPATAVVAAGRPANGAELLVRATQAVNEAGKASASFLQRRLRIGYNQADRLLDLLEESGIVSAPDVKGQRTVLGNTFKVPSTQATHNAEFERFWELIQPAYDNLCQFAGGVITKDESKERFDYGIAEQGYLDLGSVAALTTSVVLEARAKSDRNKVDKFNLKGLAYVIEKHYGGSDGE